MMPPKPWLDGSLYLPQEICSVSPEANPPPGLVTRTPLHATQRLAWIDALNEARVARGEGPLTEAEVEQEWAHSVDLLFNDGHVNFQTALPVNIVDYRGAGSNYALNVTIQNPL